MDKEALPQAFIGVLQRWRKISLTVGFSDLTMGEFFALEVLSHHKTLHPGAKGMYVSLLVDFLSVSGPAVSRMLRLLEEKGYIERTVDTEDRRNTYISMKAEGMLAWQKAQENLYRFFSDLTDSMGQEDMRMLISLWNRFIDIIDDREKNGGLINDSLWPGGCAHSLTMPVKKKEP